MISRSVIIRILLVSLFGGFILCKTGTSWSQAEKQNAVHFINTLNNALEAIRISNQGGPGPLSESELQAILKFNKEALREALIVKDSVLDKMHPELREHFRNELQRGIELRVKNLEYRDINAELEGSRLMDAWADWYIANQSGIRIPK